MVHRIIDITQKQVLLKEVISRTSPLSPIKSASKIFRSYLCYSFTVFIKFIRNCWHSTKIEF